MVQALALAATNAYEDQVAERIDDALMAPHKEGVDLARVRQAQSLVALPAYSAAVSRQVKGLLMDTAGRPRRADGVAVRRAQRWFRALTVVVVLAMGALCQGLMLTVHASGTHPLKEK